MLPHMPTLCQVFTLAAFESPVENLERVKRLLSICRLGDFAGGFFQEFVDEDLVGLGLFGGHAAKLAEKFWGDADGDELFGVAGGGAADSASAAEFGGI
jgi:hypothetical protein